MFILQESSRVFCKATAVFYEIICFQMTFLLKMILLYPENPKLFFKISYETTSVQLSGYKGTLYDVFNSVSLS